MARGEWLLLVLLVATVLWPTPNPRPWWVLPCLGLLLATLACALTHDYRCPTCRSAKRLLRELHPDWHLGDTCHRTSEPDRVVVAVFYQPAASFIRPSPYQLVAVSRDGARIEELHHSADSPYILRGRK